MGDDGSSRAGKSKKQMVRSLVRPRTVLEFDRTIFQSLPQPNDSTLELYPDR